MAESLLLGAVLVGAGLESTALCSASSHFCSAERQYRYPLEYGGQRTPTAQWTATAAGAVILTDSPTKVAVTALLPGRIFDPGVKDAANMGAAMAQAAFETIHRFLRDTGTGPEDYDLIVTGDLSAVGKSIVLELFRDEGLELKSVYDDCGMMLYDGTQDVHAGGSGCGCSAAVLCAYLLPALEQGLLKKVLFCGTGALLSPLTANQGETIPGICHAVLLEAVP
jgi:stage V sporulation protein AD